MQDKTVQQTNRITRKKNRTRQQLMDAAVTLILEKGYEDVMTDEIADLADVGRRTFYNHFGNKRKCVLEAVKERFINCAKQVDRERVTLMNESDQGAWNEVQTIAYMAAQMFQELAADPITNELTLYPRILSEAIADSQRDFIEENVANGVINGTFKPKLPSHAIEPILTWGLVGMMISSIPRKTQVADSQIWAQFILQNLGLEDKKITKTLQSLTIMTSKA
jgi:AcrR family transcriptional regulator